MRREWRGHGNASLRAPRPHRRGRHRRRGRIMDMARRMSGARSLSGVVARRLSGFMESLEEVTHETDGTATGGPEDAIRGGLRRGWQERRLTQEEAARLLGGVSARPAPAKTGVPALRGPLRGGGVRRSRGQAVWVRCLRGARRSMRWCAPRRCTGSATRGERQERASQYVSLLSPQVCPALPLGVRISVQSPVSSARTHSQACLRGAQNSADAGKAAQTRRSLRGNQDVS